MIQSLLLLINLLLLFAVVASGVCWVMVWRRRRGLSLREKVESILPARPQPRPFRSNADGLAIFVTASIMLCTMAVSQHLITRSFLQRGWIEVARPDASSAIGSDSALAVGSTSDSSDDSKPSATAASGNADDLKGERPAAVPARHLTERSLIASIVANTLAGVFSILIAVGWLGLFFRHPLQVIGLWPRREDLVLGLKATLLILPPVLLINAAVSQLITYEHEVLNSLAAFATPSVFVTTMVGTAVVTPVVEELMLRGMLQGGFQRLTDPPAVDLVTSDSSGTADVSEKEGWRPVSYWPMFVASGLFASMHIGQGAAPIALFFLSLGIGYLYRQTGNLTGPIVVHAILNSMTLVVELLKIQNG